MTPFTSIKAVAAPMEERNIDTDKLIPSRFFRKARGAGLQDYLFYDIRFDAEGRERPDFVLNQTPYRDAKILVAGANFGCGSAREAAVYVLLDYGFRAVIAPSFSDIFSGNMLQNGMLPVVLPEADCERLCGQLRAMPGAQIAVDLESQSVTGADGAVYTFAIDAGVKERLLKGLDEIGLILEHLPEIETFEERYRAEMPWRR